MSTSQQTMTRTPDVTLQQGDLPEVNKDQARSLPIAATGPGGGVPAPRSMGEVVDFARAMATAGAMLPQHLRNNPGGCMAITLQALRWNMDPFAIASESFCVNGNISYGAKMIDAVLNTRAPLKGRLRVKYEGDGQMRRAIVSGTFHGEGEPHVLETPLVKDISPKNSPLWKSDPDQQLAYYGKRAWARRYCPEVMMGIYDPDEMPERDQEMRVVSETDPAAALKQELIEPEPGQKPDLTAQMAGLDDEPTGALAAATAEKDGAASGGKAGTDGKAAKPAGKSGGGKSGTPPDEWAVEGDTFTYLANWTTKLRKATEKAHVDAMKGVNSARIGQFAEELQERIYQAADTRIDELEQAYRESLRGKE